MSLWRKLFGRVDIPADADSAPPGELLYAHVASVLPPIEAVFALGSDRVGTWLAACGWERGERYGDGFADRVLVQACERRWSEEHPVYRSDRDVVARLGGWHMPWADDDWFELLPQRLLAATIEDGEPWVEAWPDATGRLHVIERIT
jgi:hypothetical protein